MKTCIKCNKIFSYKAFYKNSHMKDGYLNKCKACLKDEVNTVAARKAAKKYRQTHPEKIKAYNKKYKSNPINNLIHKERMKEWHRINKGLSNSYKAKRRAFKLKATPKWSELEDIKEVYIKARSISVETGIQHHVDHIIPLIHSKVCGLHVLANLRIISYTDNLRKGNKLIEDIV